jgi:hypothetical protein
VTGPSAIVRPAVSSSFAADGRARDGVSDPTGLRLRDPKRGAARYPVVMPITNDPSTLRASLRAALQSPNHDPARRASAPGLSGNEVDRLVREIKSDGVTDDEVKAVVDTLVQALRDGLDVSAAREQRNIGRLLDTVDRLRPGVIADKGAFTSGTQTAWLSLLQARAQGVAPTPSPAPTPTPSPSPSPSGSTVTLASSSFAGDAMRVDVGGAVVVGGRALTLAVAGNTDAVGLLSLLKPGQLAGLDATAKQALAVAVVDHLAAGLPVDGASPKKFHAVVAAFAGCGVVAELGASLPPSSADKLAGLLGKLPSLAQEALVRRALTAAPQTAVVDAARKGFAAADAAANVVGEHDKLLASYDALRAERGRVGFADVKGEGAAAALACLAFAKGQAAVDNITKGLEVWSKLDGAYGTPLSADEARGALAMLEPYIDKATTTNLVFGAFVAEAPRAVAQIAAAATTAKVSPQLSSTKPSLGGVPLSTEQAAFVQGLLPGLRDDAAVASVSRALSAAHAALSTTITQWGAPPSPKEPLSPAAWGVFARAAEQAFDARGGTADGMIDGRALEAAVSAEASSLGDGVRPFLTNLARGVVVDGAVSVPVSPAAADALKALVAAHARSSMTTTNLAAAAVLVAQKNGGRLEGAALTQLQSIVAGYVAEFPTTPLLDFNKLARIASFAVDGKTAPLCTLNGAPVKLAEFYGKVASAVSTSIQSDLRYAWAPQRWGLRARQSVELLDVIAQKTAEKSGPLVALRQQFPGETVKVLATGKDGEHERFLYVVGGAGGRCFAEASDGRVQPYDTRKNGTDPVLFTATVRDDGAFDVDVPTTNRVRKFPTQGTYAVGDGVDVAFRDTSAVEAAEEGKPFQTQFKIAQGKIVSFDAAGQYQVEFVDSQGKMQQRLLSIDEIKKYNHPHNFAENSSLFSDVVINLQTDAALKSFLEGADPIIARHLPVDGTLLTLSPAELAKRQKACVQALMEYTKKNMKYPQEKEHTSDANSLEFHKLVGSGWAKVDLGRLIQLQRGVCRHQCIVEQLLLQRAGIDSRLASGAANTSSGAFRGFHIWNELTLADNARYLSDQTWDDAFIPLWEGAYSVDRQRVEMYDRTSRYDTNLAG